MVKLDYQNELAFTTTLSTGSSGSAVKRVQEWLSLQALHFPNAILATATDGQFGPATERAVRNFQTVLKLPKTGVVTPELFARLRAPLTTAFQTKPTGVIVRNGVLQIARSHLKQRATELQTHEAQNLGPWVRAYCNGLEGTPFKWCVGFVQTILDQTATAYGRQFTTIMPSTLSCDEVGRSGLRDGRLIENARLRANPGLIQPGDIFLLRKSEPGDVNETTDWFHVGFITHVADDVVETIEGNTDSKGGSNGTAVLARVRNFQKTTLDVFSIDGL